MKNFKTFFKTLLTVVVLLSASFGFAQVVQVPVGCTVVKPGIGGTVGPNPTGFVGNGGIVAMPDPSGGGAFNFTIASVATTASWSLLGDISNTSLTPNSTPLQPAAGSSANIFTCNKNLRTSEGVAPSLSSWARSKGQVKLFFSQSGCSGQTMTFDIFKSFTASPVTNVPKIIGPDCLKPLTVYTFSVDPIVSDNINDPIGVDSYYWSGIPTAYLPLSSPDFYTSSDGSSITFKTGASVSTFTLQCCYGRVNPTANNVDGGVSTFTNGAGSHTTCVNKTLLIAPVQPTFSATTLSTFATLNSSLSACLATGVSSFTITYPDPAAGQTYTWTCPNINWLFSTSSTAGNTTLAVNTQGDNNPQPITLTIIGNSCDPAIFTYQINRSFAAPLAVVVTGATTTCIAGTSSGNTYTISPNAAGNSVVWTTNPASITGVTLVNANTPTVTVNTSGAAAGSFSLIATSGTAACNGTNVSITINVKPATATFTTGTPNCVVRGSTLTTIAVNPVAGVATTGYTWTLPAGVTCTANCTTVNPTFVMNGSGNSSTLQVTAAGTNGCNSAIGSKTINYYTVVTTPGPFSDQYAVNGACGTVSFWTVNGVNYTTSTGNIGISGTQNNILTISGSGGAAITQVCANYPGPIVVCATSFGTSTLRQANPSNIKPIDVIKDVIIYPNPNDGNFIISVLDYQESATATLTDFSGNVIKTYKLKKGDNQLQHQELRKGTYFVVLRVDGKKEARQVIIE